MFETLITMREVAPRPLLSKYKIRAVILLIFLSLSYLYAPAAWAAGAGTLRFSEMYSGVSSLGLTLSDKLKSLDGQIVAMEGFMAPPLKPTLDFFVLTRVPMSICPFCSSDADWPYDIVMVRLDKPVTTLPFDRPIRVEGRLELGSEIDPETGFVSIVRIRATRLREAQK
ncbi:MAG: hypothetical protein LBS35_13670 [Synergistaceae bacterium]|jgi:hypothetical protein|nr:hypothetical protein [Synergistaceae bacterium]